MGVSNLGEFLIEVNKFDREDVPKIVQKATRLLALEAMTRIILRTPVDTGRARGSWRLTVNKPTEEVPDTKDKNGSKTLAGAAREVARIQPYDDVFITNNLPYIVTLEEGLYPKEVKKGSLVKGRKGKRSYVQKSQGGFSKQAPQGMVKVTLAELERFKFTIEGDDLR